MMHSVNLIIISKLCGELVRLKGDIFEVNHINGSMILTKGSVNIIDKVTEITSIKNITHFGFNDNKNVYEIIFNKNNLPQKIQVKSLK